METSNKNELQRLEQKQNRLERIARIKNEINHTLDLIESFKINNDKEGLLALCYESFFAFMITYLSKYFYYGFSDDQLLLIDQCQTDDVSRIHGVIGHRGSGKSTIEMTAYLVWVIATGRYSFSVLVKENDSVLKVAIKNIRTEIEENPDISRDFDLHIQKINPFTKKKISEKWTDTLLVVGNTILMGRTVGQDVRGLQYRNKDGIIVRPQLIVLDDIENPEKARKKANRRKLARHFYGEIVSSEDIKRGAKIINIGNLVHKDSLLMNQLRAGDDIILMPLIRNGEPANKFMYPTMADIEEKRKKVIKDPDEGKTIWLREYMLKLQSPEDQVVKEEDIHYYTPDMWDNSKTLSVVTGVDLAISEKDTADYTAMITAWLRKMTPEQEPNPKRRKRVFITPDFIYRRMKFIDIVKTARAKFRSLPIGNKFLVENNQFQEAVVQAFKLEGIRADGVRAVKDKRAKLETIAPYIEDGTILFHPECKPIIDQILDFGIDDHDDFIDALVYAVTTLVHKRNKTLAITSI